MACTIYPSCAQRRRTPPLWERGARRARSSLGRPGHLPPNSANANGKGHSARGATQARKQTASGGANSWRKEGEHGARVRRDCGAGLRGRGPSASAPPFSQPAAGWKPALRRRIDRRLQSRDGGDRLLCRRQRIGVLCLRKGDLTPTT